MFSVPFLMSSYCITSFNNMAKNFSGLPDILADTLPPAGINYGRCPSPPSSVRVSPVIYLKSGDASCTHTRPISSSASPKWPAGGVWLLFRRH